MFGPYTSSATLSAMARIFTDPSLSGLALYYSVSGRARQRVAGLPRVFDGGQPLM